MVQCYNMGSDGTDAAWKCEASMPDGYSFMSVEVSGGCWLPATAAAAESGGCEGVGQRERQ